MHILKIEERAESLKLILNYLIEWLMSSDPTSQSLRINLYATLVRFLRLIHINPSGTNSSDLENSFYVSRLDSSTVRTTPENVKWSYLPADVFSSYNEKLIEVICNDCMNGHEACKMLAMSVLSLLISITGNVRWIVYMAGRGYLKFMIESSLNSDADLKAALEQPPSNVRPLYCFSARMGLLSQFATTKIGSELLLEHSLLSCLGTMKVFDLHPEILKHAQMQVPSETMEDLGIPVENRYLQIFLPTLDLCNTIITTLGTRNKSAVIQVVYYLISHLDVVELILQNGSPLLANSFLEELDLLTSVIARYVLLLLIIAVSLSSKSLWVQHLTIKTGKTKKVQSVKNKLENCFNLIFSRFSSLRFCLKIQFYSFTESEEKSVVKTFSFLPVINLK